MHSILLQKPNQYFILFCNFYLHVHFWVVQVSYQEDFLELVIQSYVTPKVGSIQLNLNEIFNYFDPALLLTEGWETAKPGFLLTFLTFDIFFFVSHSQTKTTRSIWGWKIFPLNWEINNATQKNPAKYSNRFGKSFWCQNNQTGDITNDCEFFFISANFFYFGKFFLFFSSLNGCDLTFSSKIKISAIGNLQIISNDANKNLFVDKLFGLIIPMWSANGLTTFGSKIMEMLLAV